MALMRNVLWLRGILALVFLAAAGMKFASAPFEVEGFTRFGYPSWFMYLVGALQFVGASLLVTRSFVCHGASLLAVLMVGAVGSHMVAGDPALMPAPAFVLLLLLCGVSYGHKADLFRSRPGEAPST